MALLIKVDGTKKIVKLDGGLEQMQKLVGGYIEFAPFNATVDGVKYSEVMCNEEGKMDGLPLNPLANHLWNNRNDMLVGDVVLVKKGEVK